MEGNAFNFDHPERAALDEIGRQLRSEGWAQHVTIQSLLETWRDLALGVDQYECTIDDYTNDLCSRDGLELALSRADLPLSAKLLSVIEAADHEFCLRTAHDGGTAVGQYCRIDESSGWWWRRRPVAGPLADYLAGETS